MYVDKYLSKEVVALREEVKGLLSALERDIIRASQFRAAGLYDEAFVLDKKIDCLRDHIHSDLDALSIYSLGYYDE